MKRRMKAHKKATTTRASLLPFSIDGVVDVGRKQRDEDGIESTGKLLLTLNRKQPIEGDEEKTVDFSVTFMAV